METVPQKQTNYQDGVSKQSLPHNLSGRMYRISMNIIKYLFIFGMIPFSEQRDRFIPPWHLWWGRVVGRWPQTAAELPQSHGMAQVGPVARKETPLIAVEGRGVLGLADRMMRVMGWSSGRAYWEWVPAVEWSWKLGQRSRTT